MKRNRKVVRAWGKQFNRRSGNALKNNSRSSKPGSTIMNEYHLHTNVNYDKENDRREETAEQELLTLFSILFGPQMLEWYDLYKGRPGTFEEQWNFEEQYGLPVLIDPKILVDWARDRLAEDDAKIKQHITMLCSDFYKLELFYSSDCKKYFFIESDMIDGRMRKSIIYKSRDRAMNVFRGDTIQWKQVSNLPPV